VVRKESSDRDSIIAKLDGLTFWDVPWYIRKGLVCWRHDGDVGSRREGFCKAIHETDKLEQRAEVILGGEERSEVTLGQAGASH
jgi:hypothetical protein